MGFDVYYVKDTLGVRKKLHSLFDINFNSSNTYIHLKKDANWVYYYDYIFPENATNNFFINHQYLIDLISKGDDLSGIRKITHWVYFNDEKKRLHFKNQINILKFKIDSINYKKEKTYPYELQFSRNDYINPQKINELTKMIHVLMKSTNGIYDGWETKIKQNE